jgi:hypothetical protein
MHPFRLKRIRWSYFFDCNLRERQDGLMLNRESKLSGLNVVSVVIVLGSFAHLIQMASIVVAGLRFCIVQATCSLVGAATD